MREGGATGATSANWYTGSPAPTRGAPGDPAQGDQTEQRAEPEQGARLTRGETAGTATGTGQV